MDAAISSALLTKVLNACVFCGLRAQSREHNAVVARRLATKNRAVRERAARSRLGV